MPTPATAKWPKPRSEDEFEDIVVDFVRIRWQDPNAQRHGRRGQRQHGVDIIGRPPWLNGGIAAAQCKNYDSLKLTDVTAEVAKAMTYPGGIDAYYIVTTADRDAALQSQVRAHFRANPALFDVEVIFWPDLTSDISASDVLVAKYWKGFGPQSSVVSWRVIRAEAQRMRDHADALNRGFYGGFWQDHVRDKFRPQALEQAAMLVTVETAKHEVLQSSLVSLRGSSAAADAETDRILNGQVRHLRDLRELVLRVLNDAHHVMRCIDQLYGAQM